MCSRQSMENASDTASNGLLFTQSSVLVRTSHSCDKVLKNSAVGFGAVLGPHKHRAAQEIDFNLCRISEDKLSNLMAKS